MKKDIVIPNVENVFVAVVYEYNEMYKTNDWNAYIINHKNEPLEMVLIVSRGFSKTKKTATMRHKIEVLPAQSYAKIEYMQEAIFELNNEFKISFFVADKIFDKTYLFRPNTINLNALQNIPLMQVKGVLVK